MSKRLNMSNCFVEFGKVDRTKQKELKKILMDGLKIKSDPGLFKRLKDPSKNSEVENQWIYSIFKEFNAIPKRKYTKKEN